MKPKNTQAIHTRSTAGAHSSDGKFTTTTKGDPTSGPVHVGFSPVAVPLNIPDVNVTVRRSSTGGTADIEIGSYNKLSTLLPDTLSSSAKRRWLDDNSELIHAYAEHAGVELNDDHYAKPSLLNMPIGRGGTVSPAKVQEVVEGHPHTKWVAAVETDLRDYAAKIGTQGYGDGDDPRLDPAQVPYRVNGDAAELTGNQRVTMAALAAEVEGEHLTVSSNFYSEAFVSWDGKDKRERCMVIDAEGKMIRPTIEPLSSDTMPWLEPRNMENFEEYKDLSARVASARTTLEPVR